MKKSTFIQLGSVVAASVLVASCSTLTAPFKEADPRWADFKTWTKVTELEPSTGNPTGFLGGVHQGEEGYRDVYVNDIAEAVLMGSAPYNYPAGSVIVKEQFASKSDWEEGRKPSHTVSVKVAASDSLSKDNWIWADSYKGTAGESAFCSGCHSIAAKDDYVFTHGDFLATQ
ncbi:MAG: cytochrome P460 family protein [Granulosicoccus sp.]